MQEVCQVKLMTTDHEEAFREDGGRPRRSRHCENRLQMTDKTLELQGVVNLLKRNVDYDGGINCNICGKLYKSRVCFIKHLWEHSIYWDRFEGVKNHERVLSIQAALILYQNQTPFPLETRDMNSPSQDDNTLMSLLVTSPNEKKKDEKSPTKRPAESKMKSPSKRQRVTSGSDTDT